MNKITISVDMKADGTSHTVSLNSIDEEFGDFLADMCQAYLYLSGDNVKGLQKHVDKIQGRVAASVDPRLTEGY